MSENLPTEPPQRVGMSNGKRALVVVVLLIVAGTIYNAAHNSDRSKAARLLSAIQSAATTQTAPAQSSDPMTDKSFHLASVSFNNNDTGFAEANARVTNISDTPKSAVFSISIFESDGVTVAENLIGGTGAVQPGQTVTVAMAAKGQVPSGQFQYSFQVDLEH